MKELEQLMKASGMTDKQVENARYFNANLASRCVDRYVSPPSILYWRVHAVYVTFGHMLDSARRKPFFNKTVWKKENQVLKDILCGYYSDPPGIEMYTKN